MAKKVSARGFQSRICVRPVENGEGWIIVGDPDEPDQIDAQEGDRVAIYEIQAVKTFHTQARLD